MAIRRSATTDVVINTGPEMYVTARHRFLALITGLDDSHVLPATPAWDLRTVIAHLVGVAEDVARGAVDGDSTDGWTADQVARRAGHDRSELLAEWDAVVEDLLTTLSLPVARGLDPIYSILPVMDLLGHENDVRESLSITEPADDAAWAFVEQRRHDVLTRQITASGLPALDVRTTEGDHWTVGAGNTAGQVTAPRYELWRSLEGRRSRDAVRRFDWSVRPDPYLDHWLSAVFSWPAGH